MSAGSNTPYLEPTAASFSDPVNTGIHLANAAASLATALDAKRSIKFAVCNNTSKRLKFLGSHLDCGKIEEVPDEIDPGKSGDGYVSAKFGLYGVELAMIYQWGEDEKERVCLFLSNPVLGGNKSGIQYFWDTDERFQWYYDNVPAVPGESEMKRTINGWFTIKSYVSRGNHAGCVFILET